MDVYLNYLDIFSQLVITVTSVKAIYMVSSHKPATRMRAGVWGLYGQPFWFLTAIINEQFLLLPLYTIYAIGWFKVYIQNKKLTRF